MNSIYWFSLVYGKEHYSPRVAAVEQLCALHVEKPHIFSVEKVIEVWEELCWKYGQEVRGAIQFIPASLGTKVARRDKLKFAAMSPGALGHPTFKWPTTFDLCSPSAYFQAEIIPKMDREFERRMWDPKPLPKSVRTGKGDKPDRAYPAGPQLSAAERKLSTRNAPKDESGKSICWDFITHAGCEKSTDTCKNSHARVKGPSGLHYSVLLQCARRGGLKTSKRIDPNDISGYMKALRLKVKEEDESKRKSPKQLAAGDDPAVSRSAGPASFPEPEPKSPDPH